MIEQGNGAVRALANIAQVVEGAENRAQHAQDEVVQTLRAALEQSEANNRLLSEQCAKLGERVSLLEQTRAQDEKVNQAKQQASEEQFNALKKTVDVLLQRFSKSEEEAAALKKRYDDHVHVVSWGNAISATADTITRAPTHFSGKPDDRSYKRVANGTVGQLIV